MLAVLAVLAVLGCAVPETNTVHDSYLPGNTANIIPDFQYLQIYQKRASRPAV